MITSQIFSVLFVLASIIGFVLVVRTWPKIKTMDKRQILFASFLPLLSCVLFWSLALHMHTNFAGWPEQIGDDDFPSALKQHASIQAFIFSCTFGIAFVVAPLLALIFSLAPKLKPLLDYLGIFYLALVPLVFGFWISPTGYLDWWWD